MAIAKLFAFNPNAISAEYITVYGKYQNSYT